MSTVGLVPCRPINDAECTWIPTGYRYIEPQEADVEGACSDCDTPIWVSPSKVTAAGIDGCRLVCWPCLRPYLEEGIGVEVNLTPGQRDRRPKKL